MSMGERALGQQYNEGLRGGGLLVPQLPAAARMALGAFYRPVSGGGGGLDRFHEEAGTPTASDFKYL